MNYAVTELNDTTFNLYSALLAISGILLAVTAATGFGGRSVGARIVNGLFAVLFVGYAIYLQFIFTSGTVFISYYVFVVPILLILQAFRNRTAAKQQQAAAAQASAIGTPYPNAQFGYPPAQPGNPNPQMGYPPAPSGSATEQPAQASGPAGQPEPAA